MSARRRKPPVHCAEQSEDESVSVAGIPTNGLTHHNALPQNGAPVLMKPVMQLHNGVSACRAFRPDAASSISANRQRSPSATCLQMLPGPMLQHNKPTNVRIIRPYKISNVAAWPPNPDLLAKLPPYITVWKQPAAASAQQSQPQQPEVPAPEQHVVVEQLEPAQNQFQHNTENNFSDILYGVQHIFQEDGKVVRKVPIKVENETVWVDCVPIVACTQNLELASTEVASHSSPTSQHLKTVVLHENIDNGFVESESSDVSLIDSQQMVTSVETLPIFPDTNLSDESLNVSQSDLDPSSQTIAIVSGAPNEFPASAAASPHPPQQIASTPQVFQQSTDGFGNCSTVIVENGQQVEFNDNQQTNDDSNLDPDSKPSTYEAVFASTDGSPSVNKPHRTTQKDRDTMVKMVIEDLISPAELSRRFGHSVSAIRTWVKKAGHKLPARYQPLSSKSTDVDFKKQVVIKTGAVYTDALVTESSQSPSIQDALNDSEAQAAFMKQFNATATEPYAVGLVARKVVMCNICGSITECSCRWNMVKSVQEGGLVANEIKVSAIVSSCPPNVLVKHIVQKPNGLRAIRVPFKPRTKLIHFKRQDEPECIALSSEDENDHCDFAAAVSQEDPPPDQNPDATLPYSRPSEEFGVGNVEDEIEGATTSSSERTTTSAPISSDANLTLLIKSLRIGSYKITKLYEEAFFSDKAIQFRVPPIETQNLKNSDFVDINISAESINNILVHFRDSAPIIFLTTKSSECEKMRTLLNMTDKNSGLWFDSASEDATLQRITLILEKIPDKAQLLKMFSGIITEVTPKMANDILLMSSPKLSKAFAQNSVLNTGYQGNEKYCEFPPKGNSNDSNSVTVMSEDYLCLQKESFINDSVIDFYLKWLQHEIISEEDRNKTHIFSTFFYKSLTRCTQQKRLPQHLSSDEVQLSEAEKRHEQVKRWTRKINIFEKEFIFVPINEQSHWFLAVICFPGLSGCVRIIEKSETCAESNITKDNNDLIQNPCQPEKHGPIIQPCILIFDSLPNGNRIRISLILKEYLQCEYKEKQGRMRDFNTMPVFYPEVLQQPNLSDCGLFCLQYAESFFKNPIKDFSLPIRSLKNWFPKDVVRQKRMQIAKIIEDLAKEQNPNKVFSFPNIAFTAPSGSGYTDDESDNGNEPSNKKLKLCPLLQSKTKPIAVMTGIMTSLSNNMTVKLVTPPPPPPPPLPPPPSCDSSSATTTETCSPDKS